MIVENIDLESERELVAYLARNLGKPRALVDLLKRSAAKGTVREHLSTILSLPDRLLKYSPSYPSNYHSSVSAGLAESSGTVQVGSEIWDWESEGNFIGVLCERLVECFQDRHALPIECLTIILDRLIVLCLLPEFIPSFLLPHSPGSSGNTHAEDCGDIWDLAVAGLQVGRKYSLLKSFLLNANTQLELSAAHIDGPAFPLNLSSSIAVPFDLIFEQTHQLNRFLSAQFTNCQQQVQFASYALKKLASGLDLCQESFTLRLLIVLFLSELQMLPQFFVSCFNIWSDVRYITCNNLPFYHEYLSDLILLSLNRLLFPSESPPCSSSTEVNNDKRKMVLASIDRHLCGGRSGLSLELLFNRASMVYLECSHREVRTRGLLVIESLMNLLFPLITSSSSSSSDPDKKLNFDLEDCLEKRWVYYLLNGVPNSSFTLLTGNNDVIESANVVVDNVEDVDDDTWDSDDSDESLTPFGLDAEALGQVSGVPSPKLLKQCIHYLKQSDSDPDCADKILICLQTIPHLMSHDGRFNKPLHLMDTFSRRELKELGPVLLSRLLHLHDNFGQTGFDDLRKRALTAILLVNFEVLGGCMVEEFWGSKGLNWSQRLESLDILCEASCEYLAAGPPLKSGRLYQQNLAYNIIDRSLVSSGNASKSDEKEEHIKNGGAGKTRIFAPKSLELSMRRQQSDGGDHGKTLWGVMSAIFLPLSRGLWTSSLQWLRKEAGVYISIMPSASNEHIKAKSVSKIEISASSLALLSKWVVCLCTLLRINGPNDPSAVNYMKEMRHVAEWYWQWIHRARIRLHGVEVLEQQQQQQQQIDNSKYEVAMNTQTTLLNHPQVRMTVLFMFCTLLQLSDEIRAVEYLTSFLPFNWFNNCPESFDPATFINWLMNEVALIDRNPRHRKMACFILDRLQKRLARFNSPTVSTTRSDSAVTPPAADLKTRPNLLIL